MKGKNKYIIYLFTFYVIMVKNQTEKALSFAKLADKLYTISKSWILQYGNKKYGKMLFFIFCQFIKLIL
jgi:hypothetical protein